MKFQPKQKVKNCYSQVKWDKDCIRPDGPYTVHGSEDWPTKWVRQSPQGKQSQGQRRTGPLTASTLARQRQGRPTLCSSIGLDEPWFSPKEADAPGTDRTGPGTIWYDQPRSWSLLRPATSRPHERGRGTIRADPLTAHRAPHPVQTRMAWTSSPPPSPERTREG